MRKAILGLLLAGVLSAADQGGVAAKTPNIRITDRRAVVRSPSIGLPGSGASDDAAVIALVRSSGGLFLNGVPTPPGVNSVVVTRGDVVETVGAPAVATYATGQIVNLAPATTYQSLPGRLVPGITSTKSGKTLNLTLPPVSGSAH
jgi:hypothetical protein